MTEWRDMLEAIGADDYNRLVAQGTQSSFGALLGDPEALEDAQAATRAARRLGNPDRIAMSLLSLGMNLARRSPEEALAALEESVAIMRAGNTNSVGMALSNVAQLRARQGDRVGALTTLRESIEHIYRYGDRPQLIALVDWAIAILQRFGYSDPAAVLVGVAVDGPLAALNSFPGARRAHGDDKLAPLEAELGTDTYRALVERGAAMSYEEVVHFLFDEIDQLLAEEDAAADA